MEYAKYQVCNEVKEAIKNHNVAIEKAIRVITKNPAEILALENKGTIEEGKDADLVIVKEDTLDIDLVIAKGKVWLKVEASKRNL